VREHDPPRSGTVLTVHPRRTGRHAECVRRVTARYLAAYGARVRPDPEFFVALESSGGELLAVAGLTEASAGPLLSESYLAAPVEVVCGWLEPFPPSRATIAELGQVTSLRPGGGTSLLGHLPDSAADLGFTHLLVTATRRLHGICVELGWKSSTVANARCADLPAERRRQWGTYYTTKPRTQIVRCGSFGTGPRRGTRR
jgi:hypothetical protein